MDHSNTRLASQLDRNPGSFPSRILVVGLEFFGGCFSWRGEGHLGSGLVGFCSFF